jgi:hypothetical protein
MNSDVMHSKVQMEPAILKNLTAEVKETLAKELVPANNRKSSFGAVQLWNIRRNGRRILRRDPRIVTGFGY